MARTGRSTINYVVAIAGALILAYGIVRLSEGMSVFYSLIAVLGFLVAGYGVFDERRARRGTPESEVDGGRTIE